VRRPSVSLRRRKFVLKRDGYTCQYCGLSGPDIVLEVDHKHPVSRGGSNHTSNLATACFACNRTKGTKLIPPKTESLGPSLESLEHFRWLVEVQDSWRRLQMRKHMRELARG
jgi:5-methylcytosine-specific restriction endonuclease McrA